MIYYLLFINVLFIIRKNLNSNNLEKEIYFFFQMNLIEL